MAGGSEKGQQLSEDELRFLLQLVTRTIRRHRVRDELSDAQLSVLFAIERLGIATPSQLAEIEGVSPPAINRTLNRLQTLGLITRTQASQDGRRVLIQQTEAGEQRTRATHSAIAAWFHQQLAEMPAEERAALDAAVPALQRIAAG